MRVIVIVLITCLFSACATVPMESSSKSKMVKRVNKPTLGNAGLYIYRSAPLTTVLKKEVWVNGQCIGQMLPNVFFYKQVEGDKAYRISSTEGFSENEIMLETKAGKNYFIQQYTKLGLDLGDAGLRVVDEDLGRLALAELEMAKRGQCNE